LVFLESLHVPLKSTIL